MRFALLCDDPRVEPILKSFGDQSSDHRLVYAVGQMPFSVSSTIGGIKFVRQWEDLLTARDVDAAIVGGSSQAILDGAKQLAAAGIPLLFVPKFDQGSTFIYELSLIRDDNRVPLVPVQWHRFDSAAVQLKADIEAGKFGRISFLQITSTATKLSAGTALPLAEVDEKLLPDVELLRWLIGDYDQVTCLRTGSTAEGVQMQNVVLAGRSFPEANWSVSPTDGSETWQLIVRGEKGSAKLDRGPSSSCFEYELNDQRSRGDEAQTSQRVIDGFVSLVSDQATIGAKSSVIDRDWGDLVKCFETVDATHRSIRRKRTIELHFEPMSERAIFKTQMTAIGCGVLMATLFLMLLYLGVASFVEPMGRPRSDSGSVTDATGGQTDVTGSTNRNRPLPIGHRILQILRLLVFAPLVIFLLAQVLLPLTRPSSNERKNGRADGEVP